MYNKEELSIFWFSLFDKITNKKLGQLAEIADSFASLRENLSKYKDEVVKVVGLETYSNLKLSQSDAFIKKMIDKLADKGAKFTTVVSDDYPKMLKDIEDFPYILYYKGDLSVVNGKTIAVVGTRKPTRYGQIVTKQFTKDLVTAGCTIVSGGARGVDSIAIKEALELGSKPIVVLGCGVDVVYPPENKNLFDEVVKVGGLITSEYPIKTPPNAYNFPQRNRIISGLSIGVLVTEAGLKSGTMITADTALNQGKEVFLVPGNVNSQTSAGTNNMLKEGYGNLVTEPNDILSHYKINEVKSVSEPVQLDYNESAIMEEIRKNGEVHFEQLLSVVDFNDVNELNNLLFNMQLKGLIVKLPGNFYGE